MSGAPTRLRFALSVHGSRWRWGARIVDGHDSAHMPSGRSAHAKRTPTVECHVEWGRSPSVAGFHYSLFLGPAQGVALVLEHLSRPPLSFTNVRGV